MADYGSHITVSQVDNPSVYDVVAQESLLENLQPAFEHVLKVFTDKFPEKLSALYQYSDEVYFVLHSVLQYHYLNNYGASFSENFYGLKRCPISYKGEPSRRLGLKDKILTKSLVTLCVLPYARHYLKKKYLQKLEQRETSPSSNETKSIWEKLKLHLIDLWPLLHLIVEVTTIVYYLRYFLGKQKVQHPFLHLCGATLTCLTEDDQEMLDQKSQAMMRISNVKSLQSFCQWFGAVSGFAIQNSLEIGAFFLQFLDWFYSNNSSKAQLFASNAIPPPPKQSPDDSNLMNICPLCFKEPRSETVLIISGYVFCYSCILPYVKTHEKCPVTKCPASTKQLIRIYKR